MAWRRALLVAAFVAGLATAVAGTRLLAGAEPPPRAPQTVNADVPPPAAAPARLADIRLPASGSDRSLALYRLAGQQGAAGLERLLEAASALEQPSERAAALSILYARYADLDPAAALRHVLQRGADATFRLLHIVCDVWARTEPRTALDAIGSADGLASFTRSHFVGRVLASWAAADPAAALGWALARPDSRTRGPLVEAVVEAWAEHDPRAAAQWLVTQANIETSWRALEEVARSYAARHPEEAVAWVLALPAEKGGGPMASVLRTLATEYPERAAALFAGIGDAEARGKAERWLAHSWADIEPRTALAWLDRPSDRDPVRHAALYAAVIEQWAGYDVAGAMRHLDRLTDPRTRDKTILVMLKSALHFDLALAEELFKRIETDGAQRAGAAALHEHLPTTIAPSRAARRKAAASLYDYLTSAYPPDERQSHRYESSVMRTAYKHLAQTDPSAATSHP